MNRPVNKHAAEINNISERAFDTPNIYAWLVDRGVSDSIADDAQQMVVEHFLDYSENKLPKLSKEFVDAADRLNGLFSDAERAVRDIMKDLEDGRT